MTLPVIFKGNAEHAIDAKLRLSIPAKFRAKLPEGGRRMNWTALPWDKGVIRLYPTELFDALALEYGKSIAQTSAEAKKMRILFGFAEETEQDDNGRIKLTPGLIEQAELGSEVVISGCGQWLEINDRDVWQKGKKGALGELHDLLDGMPGQNPGSTS